MNLRFTLCALLLLKFGINLKAEIRIEYSLNETFCLVQFAEQISTHRGSGPFMRILFEKSDFSKNDALLARLLEFERLDMGTNIEYQEFPQNHKLTTNAWNFFIIKAASAKNLGELEQNSYGLFPSSVHQKIFDLLKLLQPIYKKLIWDPYKNITEKNIEKIKTLGSSRHLNLYFTKLSHFYGSTWNENIPLRVQFYPVPGRMGFSATPKGNIISCGLLCEEKDWEGVIGVLFHEMAHVLYDEQPVALQKKLERWFAGNNPFAPLAYLLFNESTATACGNGYIFEQLTGAPDKHDWYDDVYINKQAKAIYDLTKKYIETGKTIDSVYVQNVKTTYEQIFTGSYAGFDNLLSNVSVVAFGQEDTLSQFFYGLMERYRLRNFSLETNNIGDKSARLINEGLATRLLITTLNNSENLEMFKSRIPALKNIAFPSDGNYLYAFFSPEGMPFIIVNITEASKLNTLFSFFANNSIPNRGFLKKEL